MEDGLRRTPSDVDAGSPTAGHVRGNGRARRDQVCCCATFRSQRRSKRSVQTLTRVCTVGLHAVSAAGDAAARARDGVNLESRAGLGFVKSDSTPEPVYDAAGTRGEWSWSNLIETCLDDRQNGIHACERADGMSPLPRCDRRVPPWWPRSPSFRLVRA